MHVFVSLIFVCVWTMTAYQISDAKLIFKYKTNIPSYIYPKLYIQILNTWLLTLPFEDLPRFCKCFLACYIWGAFLIN